MQPAHIYTYVLVSIAGIIIVWFMFTARPYTSLVKLNDDLAYTFAIQVSIHTSRVDLELRIVSVYFMLTSVEGD